LVNVVRFFFAELPHLTQRTLWVPPFSLAAPRPFPRMTLLHSPGSFLPRLECTNPDGRRFCSVSDKRLPFTRVCPSRSLRSPSLVSQEKRASVSLLICCLDEIASGIGATSFSPPFPRIPGVRFFFSPLVLSPVPPFFV